MRLNAENTGDAGRLSPMLPPASVLAWSEARVDEPEERGPCIAFWRPKGMSVAIGISQDPMVELDVDAVRRDSIGLIRRQSGGGAVLLYPGVLCWEAWAGFEEIGRLSADGHGIRPTYRALCRPLVDALTTLGCAAFHAGICDISCSVSGLPARKLAGTAQMRRKDMALVHGSLLVNPDMEVLAKYLRFPSSQPDYRANRTHRDFCVSLAEFMENARMPQGGSLMDRVVCLAAARAEEDGWRVLVPEECDNDTRARTLARDKYGAAAWNWERKRPT